MLTAFFHPASVALVGASRDETKLGYRVLKNIVEGGFAGRVYPVNPKGGEVLGLKCYPDIASLPESVDLAVLVIPATFVLDVVVACGQRGTRAVIVISAGFREAGDEGRAREREVVAACRRYGMRLIGPNCLGVIDVPARLNASFAAEMPPAGRIAFVSQSGALGTAVLDWAVKEGVGLSKFVSVGNMADVSESDLIEMLADDPDTSVILVYVEGIADGKRFIDVCRMASKKKPIIAVKSGVTSSGLKAVSSHTGSLAGSDRAYEAAFKQAGVLRAASVEELFDYALAFAFQPKMAGDRIAIVTNAGGPAVMATDAAEKSGLKLATLSDATRASLAGFLSPAASTANPVDAIGDCLAAPYGRAVETVAKDPGVSAVLAILTPQVVTQIPESAQEVVRVARSAGKPVAGCFMGGERISAGVRILVENGVPNYPFPERAVAALRGMCAYGRWREKPEGVRRRPSIDAHAVREVFKRARREGRATLGDTEGKKVLDACGIRTVSSEVAADPDRCVEIAHRIGFPLVMKLVSPDILHKTEAGGVRVGIRSEEEARKAWQEIVDAARAYRPDARIEGVQLQEMVTEATEVIIGVSRDAQFGHLLMFGLGGIFVELMKDVSFRVVPVSTADVDEMLAETKGAAILNGFRNIPPSDVDAVKDVLVRVSALCEEFPEIAEMDINPLMVRRQGKGAVAVDVRFGL